ncbi:MAG: dihydrofolate reductase [Bacteroidota bacterium]
MDISAIVATDRNGTIGRDGQIPWYLPADLRYFKKITLGHPVVMGRKTFESIGRPLPKRTNIVLTRDPFYMSTGISVVHDIQEVLNHPACTGADEVFIIGGGEIYRQALAFTRTVYLTVVDTEILDGDAFFPALSPEEWQETWFEEHAADEKNEFSYRFSKWERL